MQTHQLAPRAPPNPNTEGGPASATAVKDLDEGKASWTDTDEDELIQFLINNKSTAGDGGNFKNVMWNAAAAHMRKFTTKGGAKTVNACKSKWGRVNDIFTLSLHEFSDRFLTVTSGL
jgi:hypothetical protein